MLAVAASRLGYRCHVFEPQQACPAGDVAAHTAADYDDYGALERFADSVDVVTLEFENVPVETVRYLAERLPVRPGADALAIAQDRIAEKTFLNKCAIQTAPWEPVNNSADLERALATIGCPAVLKTARFGYDGKGQATIPDRGVSIAEVWKPFDGKPCILEGFVSFELEISVLAARTADGRCAIYDPVENRHRNHILHKTIVPAAISDATAQAAIDIARNVVETMQYVGLLAIEMFVTGDGEILANEIAPRPHNSGHWSIDAAVTSQFEQTVRAICGLPLGDTGVLVPCEMTNLIGNEADAWQRLLTEPGACVHLYGKRETRPGRKMGHVTRVRLPDNKI